MSDSTQIEILVRGVCVKNGNLLLCRTKGDPNTYLPGGHVEFMEKAVDSLPRELKEETGFDVKVGRFLGAVEHTFLQKGERHCEINLVFELDIRGIAASKDPCSCEDYIEFRWVPMSKLAESKLEPAVLRNLLPSWLAVPGDAEHWASTYE